MRHGVSEARQMRIDASKAPQHPEHSAYIRCSRHRIGVRPATREGCVAQPLDGKRARVRIQFAQACLALHESLRRGLVVSQELRYGEAQDIERLRMHHRNRVEFASDKAWPRSYCFAANPIKLLAMMSLRCSALPSVILSTVGHHLPLEPIANLDQPDGLAGQRRTKPVLPEECRVRRLGLQLAQLG